jgi:hypothetical protein
MNGRNRILYCTSKYTVNAFFQEIRSEQHEATDTSPECSRRSEYGFDAQIGQKKPRQ